MNRDDEKNKGDQGKQGHDQGKQGRDNDPNRGNDMNRGTQRQDQPSGATRPN